MGGGGDGGLDAQIRGGWGETGEGDWRGGWEDRNDADAEMFWEGTYTTINSLIEWLKGRTVP